MSDRAQSSLQDCATELTKPTSRRLLGVALGLALIAATTSGCAVRVVNHGSNGGPYNRTEVVLGGGRVVSDGLTSVEQAGIPVISGAAAQMNQQRAYVDAQGRTVLQVPRRVPTRYCADIVTGRVGTDCRTPAPPANAGFHVQTAPDHARVVCPAGASLVTAVDQRSAENTEYLVCRTGQGGMVSAGLQVNGTNYWLQPPPGEVAPPNSFGAFDAKKVRAHQFSTAGVWLNNTP